MTWKKPDTSYWNNKLAAWWHDPVDKVFGIQRHEERAAEYLQVFGIDRPNDEFWKIADAIAAGFERGQVPSYSANNKENGAVDFVVNPVITHPTSATTEGLKIIGEFKQVDEIHNAALDFLKKTIGTKLGKGDLAAEFKNDEERFAVARFFYTHFVLRFALAEQDIGGLGALWHRLPADSRFPDHSIWQHNALCSAISSCIELGGGPEQVALMVFSITPVQGYISKARKLRDFWAGSVFLSWLAFEGLRWVMENLGPDHVLYPSLIDQPLVNEYLKREWKVSGKFTPRIWREQNNGIASLPNKFLFLVPFGKVEEIASEIERVISDQWKQLSVMTINSLLDEKNFTEEERKHLAHMFSRQTENFWEFQWASARLADSDDKAAIETLMDESYWRNQFEYLVAITPILNNRGYSLKDNSRGVLYSTSHSIVQSALAAEKSRRTVTRKAEPGEKCQMCGEFEALHGTPWQGEKASEYKENIDNFWQRFSGDDDFKENEHLCAMCFIKRYAPRVLKKSNGHILQQIFRNAESFPSTTMMALTGYFERNNISNAAERQNIADRLYESKTDEVSVNGRGKITNTDKYYAILMMDGDNMGKLVSGETIASTWKSIMHPQIVRRLTSNDFIDPYRAVWTKIYDDENLNKRLVTPAIHAAISESLGDFSMYGVAPIIDKYNGRLIYAGGDDVCAFLPFGNALFAAREIQEYYTSTFRLINMKGDSTAISGEWTPQPGKMSINLGKGDDISISAAILICHHKESLTRMIEEAHNILDREAKEKAGRNACVVELKKRHGGSRFFTRKWTDKESWNAFEKIGTLTMHEGRRLSRSLLYRLETMRDGIEAIINSNERSDENLIAFIAKQVERSGLKLKDVEKKAIAQSIARIVWDKQDSKRPFNPEGLLVAAFMGGEDEND